MTGTVFVVDVVVVVLRLSFRCQFINSCSTDLFNTLMASCRFLTRRYHSVISPLRATAQRCFKGLKFLGAKLLNYLYCFFHPAESE